MAIAIAYIIYYFLSSFSSSVPRSVQFPSLTGSSSHRSAPCPTVPFLLRFHISFDLPAVILRQDRLLLLSLYSKQPTLLFFFGVWAVFMIFIPLFVISDRLFAVRIYYVRITCALLFLSGFLYKLTVDMFNKPWLCRSLQCFFR